MTWEVIDSKSSHMVDRVRGLSMTGVPIKYGYDFQVYHNESALIAFMAYLDTVDDSQPPPEPISFTWAVVSSSQDLPLAERQELIEDVLSAWKMSRGKAFDRTGRLRQASVGVTYNAKINEM